MKLRKWGFRTILSRSGIILNFEAHCCKVHCIHVTYYDVAHVLVDLSQLCCGHQSEHKASKQARDARSSVPTSYLGCLCTDLSKHITRNNFFKCIF
jgi:hypothetical protein